MSKTIFCASHGESAPVAVSRHLCQDVGLHYLYLPPSRSLPFGQAYCEACLDEGGWNERAREFAGITVICTGCFNGVAGRNHEDGAALLLASKRPRRHENCFHCVAHDQSISPCCRRTTSRLPIWQVAPSNSRLAQSIPAQRANTSIFEALFNLPFCVPARPIWLSGVNLDFLLKKYRSVDNCYSFEGAVPLAVGRGLRAPGRTSKDFLSWNCQHRFP
jgi:hypothetical protein